MGGGGGGSRHRSCRREEVGKDAGSVKGRKEKVGRWWQEGRKWRVCKMGRQQAEPGR